MKSLLSIVSSVFEKAITVAFPDVPVQVSVNQCQNEKFGHYQCNNAMLIFKAVKGKPEAPRSPQAVGETIVKHIDSNIFERIEVARAGFINAFISKEWISTEINTLISAGCELKAEVDGSQKKKVFVDFSSPNIAKEMHVGHLRSTIIGDVICRLLAFQGHEVHPVNHVGDWGTQFGMLIAHLKDIHPGFESNPPPISDLQSFYRASKVRFDKDPEFKLRAQKEVVLLQGGDEGNLTAWKLICSLSRTEFQKVYDRLGINIEEVGESFYNPYIPSVIEDLEARGIAVEDNGAMCVFVPGQKAPLMVRKSDGGFNYDSTDMTAVWWRVVREKANWLVYVVDSGQAVHFDAVFKGARKAGWVDDSVRLDHVGFGVVLGEDGKKLKTRSSQSEKLVDLLDEAVRRAKATIIEKQERDGGNRFTEEEVDKAAHVIGYGAVKYADLKSNRLTNYTFSYDRMLEAVGNTAVYLEYAHARISSVSRKAGKEIDEIKQKASVLVEEHAELDLCLMILRFQDMMEFVLKDLYPHRLCEYLFETATKFSAFWRDCQVVGHEKEDSRLLICDITAAVLRQGLNLLGVDALFKI